jgi:hypothetical protein
MDTNPSAPAGLITRPAASAADTTARASWSGSSSNADAPTTYTAPRFSRTVLTCFHTGGSSWSVMITLGPS